MVAPALCSNRKYAASLKPPLLPYYIPMNPGQPGVCTCTLSTAVLQLPGNLQLPSESWLALPLFKDCNLPAALTCIFRTDAHSHLCTCSMDQPCSFPVNTEQTLKAMLQPLASFRNALGPHSLTTACWWLQTASERVCRVADALPRQVLIWPGSGPSLAPPRPRPRYGKSLSESTSVNLGSPCSVPLHGILLCVDLLVACFRCLWLPASSVLPPWTVRCTQGKGRYVLQEYLFHL